MTTSKGEGARVFLRPPMGNNAFYSREYLSMARNCVMKAWPTPSNSLRREVALTLLADPELRLRICHLEEILRGRQLTGRLQANGFTSGGQVGNGKDLPPVPLQTALADPSFSSLFELDTSVNDPDWGMQVLWLNMTQLQKELGLPPTPSLLQLPLQQQLQTPSSAAATPVAQPSKSPSFSPASETPSATAVGTPAATAAAATSQPPPVPDLVLLSAVEAAFPNYATDDDDYLSVATGFCLASWRDPKRLLPALSLHLTDLTAHLRACALSDPRLASALQRLATAGPQPLAARVAELLATAPRARLYFRQNESLSRRGERVVSLAAEQLMRLKGGGGSGRAQALSSNGVLPYETWQRAGATPVTGAVAAASGAAAGAALPVFLFEYEAPADVEGRDDKGRQTVARRDQNGVLEIRQATVAANGVVGGSSPRASCRDAAGYPSTAASTASAPVAGAAAAAAANSGGGGGLQLASSGSGPAGCVLQQLSPMQQQQLRLLQSEPVPQRGGDAVERNDGVTMTSLQPPPPSASSDSGYGASAGDDLYGFRNLGLGIAATAAWSTSVLAGTSPPSNGFGNGVRLSLFHSSSGSGGGGSGETMLQQTIAAAAANTVAPLAASPGGPAGELHVPQEIADVWSNSAIGGGGGGLETRRSSVAAPLNGGGGGLSALPADGGGMSGVFAMSPTHESSLLDRLAARAAATQQSIPAVGRSSGTTSAAADQGFLGLGGGFGLGGYAAAGGTASLGLGVGTPFAVGSAPTLSLAASSTSGAVAAATAAAAGGGFAMGSIGHGGSSAVGLGNGGGGFGSGAAPMDYASWHSTTAGLSSSVGGRSAPVDHAAAALDSWMLSYGARLHVGGDGGSAAAITAAAAGSRGGGLTMLGAVTAAAGSGGAAAAAGHTGRAGATTSRRAAQGQSPSVSEESEEAASVVGGLDMDPGALTLEAIIGFDPSSQFDNSTGMARRATISGPAVTAAGIVGNPGKGLIAAAAGPRVDAVAVNVAASPSAKSFASISVNSISANATAGVGGGTTVATTGSGSRHSSLDSCEVLNGGGAAANNCNGIVPTSWSAMAARGLPVPAPPSYNHHTATGGMHLAAAAAAASAGRFSAPQLQHSLLSQPAGTTTVAMTGVQGLAATMAAINTVAVGGGSNGALAAPPPPRHGGDVGATVLAQGGGLVGVPALPPAAATAVPRDVFVSKAMHNRLSQRVKDEIYQLIRSVPGLRAEDFDDGVLHQLTLKKSEEEAVGALRTLASENLSGIQHMAAYINHIIKNYHLTVGAPGAGAAGAAAASLPSATVRANSTPVSSKAILQKLPLRVYKRLEEVISRCTFMEWKHFDAGVVKVMAQLAEIGEEDVFEELELLQSTDLSNVEYMPAYLNKRLNNRLWSRRKMLTSAAAAAVGGP